MIDQYKHQQLQIGLVSPQQIKAWANKILPNGEVVGEVDITVPRVALPAAFAA